MVCVCNWSIRRTWKGVLLSTIIGMAESRAKKLYLKQNQYWDTRKGVYQATIPLEDALVRRALLIHSVDGEPLPPERLSAKTIRFWSVWL